MEETKKCTKCGEIKPLKDFFRNNDGKSGAHSRCKVCHTEQIKKWKHDNRERCRKTQNKRRNFRTANDPIFKLKKNLRKRVHATIRKGYKSSHTMELIGCPVEDLKSYLQSKFQEGMSWENYGEWHIDHIRPCASFNLTDPAQQKECFHFSNLQPLWAEENMRKGANYACSSN